MPRNVLDIYNMSDIRNILDIIILNGPLGLAYGLMSVYSDLSKYFGEKIM